MSQELQTFGADLDSQRESKSVCHPRELLQGESNVSQQDLRSHTLGWRRSDSSPASGSSSLSLSTLKARETKTKTKAKAKAKAMLALELTLAEGDPFKGRPFLPSSSAETLREPSRSRSFIFRAAKRVSLLIRDQQTSSFK